MKKAEKIYIITETPQEELEKLPKRFWEWNEVAEIKQKFLFGQLIKRYLEYLEKQKEDCAPSTKQNAILSQKTKSES